MSTHMRLHVFTMSVADRVDLGSGCHYKKP